MFRIVVVVSCALVGCASPIYWVRSGTGWQQTAADLSACRVEGNQGGQKAFSGFEMEAPCMGAKGYSLSKVPPG